MYAHFTYDQLLIYRTPSINKILESETPQCKSLQSILINSSRYLSMAFNARSSITDLASMPDQCCSTQSGLFFCFMNRIVICMIVLCGIPMLLDQQDKQHNKQHKRCGTAVQLLLPILSFRLYVQKLLNPWLLQICSPELVREQKSKQGISTYPQGCKKNPDLCLIPISSYPPVPCFRFINGKIISYR